MSSNRPVEIAPTMFAFSSGISSGEGRGVELADYHTIVDCPCLFGLK
jgi:hypothetical protein